MEGYKATGNDKRTTQNFMGSQWQIAEASRR